MANKNWRENARGVERETLDLLFEVITPYQWGMLLKAPLLRAVADGNRGLVQELAGAGAEFGSALHEAVLRGYGDMVNDLLANGAPLNGKEALERCQAYDEELFDDTCKSPLHVAVKAGKMAMVKLLLLKGADKAALDTENSAPLSLAERYGRADIRRVLIEHGADAPGDGSTAADTVENNENWRDKARGVERETLDLLFEVITPRQWGMLLKAPLLRAVADGNRGLVQELAGAGAEFGSALHEAVLRGYGDMVNDLLANGAPLNGKEALERCQAYDEEFFDDTCKSPLHVAVKAGKMAMVKLLLLKGANKDALDTEKLTPLSLAARCWRVDVDIMRVLIEHGADVNHAGGHNQRSVLHVAAGNNAVAAVHVLVEAGAHIDARDDTGATPLHYAAGCFFLEAAAALCHHGADINARDLRQSTPLHVAAAMAGDQGTANMVDFLLRSGADETIVDEDGKAAVDVVRQRHQFEEDCYYEDGREVEAEHLELVRDLLANAPADRADRALRLRVYLVLCRAHPDRMQQAHQSRSELIAGPRGTRRDTVAQGTERGRGCGATGGRTVKNRTGVDWEDVVARVVGLQEEGIFRAIVGYL